MSLIRQTTLLVNIRAQTSVPVNSGAQTLDTQISTCQHKRSNIRQTSLPVNIRAQTVTTHLYLSILELYP